MEVADAGAPQILAAVELAADGAVPEGAVELCGELLYHGMSRTDSVTGPDEQVTWVTSHWLGRLGLGDPARPVQIIIAGKAHPRDEDGRRIPPRDRGRARKRLMSLRALASLDRWSGGGRASRGPGCEPLSPTRHPA